MPTLSRRQLVGLLMLTLMWGLNWPIMKISLREMSPLHFRAATMAGGALVLAAWFGWRGLRLLPRGAAEWRAVVVLGAPNILGWHALAIIGVAHLPAGRAAILGFTMPVWAVLLGVLFYGERFTARLALALLLEPAQRWQFSAPVWTSLVWSVLINYGAAQAIWFALARALPSSTSAMSVMAVPMVGVLSSPLIVGEWPSWQDLAAMACVVVAIGAVLLRPAVRSANS